ncbi:hypothetical protein T05_12811, partial [Trichinella murrelli]
LKIIFLAYSLNLYVFFLFFSFTHISHFSTFALLRIMVKSIL